MSRGLIKNYFLRRIVLFLGFISLTIGVIGIFVPMLPGVVFILISAYLFSKTSQKFYDWLLNNKQFGQYVRDYNNGAKMPVRAKVITGLLILISLTVSFFVFVKQIN
ncbi:MAG: DUF454 domain-containing protein [Chlorobiaceae bacterium]|nr:DUF454 domain-containing protein [Chlorobiaceae bacterium]MBA4309917.1 DUF454 domain-containing protein [Chlorobiaceae bacterium]